MKITIEKSSLLKVLDRAKSVTDAKGPIPILSHVKLKADPDKLHGCLEVFATDLLTSIRTEVSCSVDEEGDLCVNAKDLYERLRSMPDGEVKFIAADNKLTIKAAKSARKFVLHTLPAAEYPSPVALSAGAKRIGIKDSDLVSRLDAVIYAVSLDETRKHLNSVCLELDEVGNSNCYSTDGHRVSIYRSGKTIGGPEKILVPLNAAKELIRLCQESAKSSVKEAEFHEVSLYPDVSNLFVNVNGFEFSCKLIQETFPPINQIIPTSSNNVVSVATRSLIDALKAVSVSVGESGGIKLSITPDKLVLNAESSHGGGTDEIDCVTSVTATYGVSVKYLVQALEQVNTDRVLLKLNDELDPILIEEEKEKNGEDEYLAIVMPMKC